VSDIHCYICITCNYYYYYYSHSLASFQEDLGKLLPKREVILDFEARNDGGGGWLSLQFFDTVGWATGRASGL